MNLAPPGVVSALARQRPCPARETVKATWSAGRLVITNSLVPTAVACPGTSGAGREPTGSVCYVADSPFGSAPNVLSIGVNPLAARSITGLRSRSRGLRRPLSGSANQTKGNLIGGKE